MGARLVVMIAVVLSPLAPCVGQGWSEIDDAAEFPAACAQPASGVGPLATISGSTDTGGDDFVDAYLIEIVDPEAFIATTSTAVAPAALASWNTRLFLFDSNGVALLANDDAFGSGDAQSLLTAPSAYGGDVGPTASRLEPGRHVLVITGWANDPADADGLSMFDFGAGAAALVGPRPDAGPFDHWENFHGLVQSGAYVIALAGAALIAEVTEPCPADLNCDLTVDVDDLTAIILAWGGAGPEDVDGSGLVDVDDLLAVLIAWGPCR